MSDEKKLPKRRFKEFLNTPSWEQHKLGEVATFSKGNGYSKSDLVSDGQPIILYGRLYTNYETTINKVDTFVELKDNSVISQGGEVIVPASGETAEDISRAAVIENQGIIIGGDLNVIRVKELLNPTFLALTISNGEQQKELSKRAQGKSVVHLHNSDLQEVNLVFPTLNEQKEISSFFEKLDDAITLHQRKLNKLENLKKAYLEELFPDGKQCKPKRRFKEFKEDWEQRKLGQCSVIITGGTPSTRILEYWSPKEIPWMSSGEINKKRISKTDDKISKLGLEQSSARWVKKNSILIALAGQGKTRGTVAINGIDLTTNQSIAAIELDSVFNTEFVFQNLDSRYDELRKESSGDGTRGGLNKKIISDLYIPYTEYKEQDSIGDFFKKLDNLITLHQRKLKKLKNLKEAYLGELFV